MSTEKKQNTTSVKTTKVRLSYVNVFTPRSINTKDPNAEKKYGLTILFPKTDKALKELIEAAIEAAKQQGKAEKWSGKMPVNLKTPLRDGDTDKENEEYKGMYFVQCYSKEKPGIIDRQKNAINDPGDLYSGCYARVTLNFYPFDASGNKGVAAGLQNIQKLEEGERLSGRAAAEDDFDDEYEDDEI